MTPEIDFSECGSLYDRPSSGGSRRPDSRYGGVPIIIVPKAYETNLNMFNAQVCPITSMSMGSVKRALSLSEN